jgi:hypothetical protein
MPDTTDAYRQKYPGMVDPKPAGPIEKGGFKAVSLFALVCVVGFVIYGMDLGFVRDEITAYGLSCNTPSGEMPCGESDLVRMEPVTYKVLVDQQAVILILPDFPPRRLKDCVVVSRTDWKCESFVGGDFGFQGGQFWEGWPSATQKARFVNRYQWLMRPARPNQR